MKRDRQIYLLDPQKLAPETIAVTFAKTSRSPESFREIAAELTESKSAAFNEKWVVGYGHSSVAEHAVLHIAVENISRLAVETLESNRLASYTEKSTRYQTWGADAFFTPQEFAEPRYKEIFANTCSGLFAAYQTCLARVNEYLLKGVAAQQCEQVSQFEKQARLAAIDACRFLLPAAALANVGVTINARALEHAIGKLLTSPLEEVRQVGNEIKSAAIQSVPTLLKYADEIPYLVNVCSEFANLHVASMENSSDWCRLVHHDSDALTRILAAAVYHEQNVDYTQALDWARSASSEQAASLLNCLLALPDTHTIPARELESAAFTFDLLIDQGAYFEVKRHRMMTQTPQRLTARLGFAVPRLLVVAGLQEIYTDALENARAAYQVLERVHPAAASYIVPNAFNRRVLLTTNLRSLVHFIRLRSAPNAHFSVRRAAQRMAEEVTARLPALTGLLGKNENESSASVEAAHFQSTCQ